MRLITYLLDTFKTKSSKSYYFASWDDALEDEDYQKVKSEYPVYLGRVKETQKRSDQVGNLLVLLDTAKKFIFVTKNYKGLMKTHTFYGK